MRGSRVRVTTQGSRLKGVSTQASGLRDTTQGVDTNDKRFKSELIKAEDDSEERARERERGREREKERLIRASEKREEREQRERE